MIHRGQKASPSASRGKTMKQFPITALLKIIPAILTLLLASASGRVDAQSWQDADIGAPPSAGSHTLSGGALTVVGSGAGDTYNGNDQLHYTYYQFPGGDIDIIARISAFTGSPGGRAGIMLRAGNSPGDISAEISFQYQAASDGNNGVGCDAHDPSTTYGGLPNDGVETRMTTPMWLRLVRMGLNFGVYKSPDGKIWSMLGNTSGWQFAPSGPIEVGFFTSSGSSTSAASATFDNILIGPPAMGYETSWFGNTFGGNISDDHVSGGITSLWTGSDGSCYTNSYYDEGGEASKIYRNGQVVKGLSEGNPYIGNSECGEGSITSDGTNLYLLSWGWEGNQLLKTDMLADSASTTVMYLSFNQWDSTNDINIISGLAVSGENLYIADSQSNLIHVATTTTLPSYTTAGTLVNTTTQTITTTGVANAAPEIVYQSQRECNYCPYTIPGLTPNTTYTLRIHFAEYTETQPGKRLVDVGVSGGPVVRNYDVVAEGGGPFAASVLDIPGAVSDANGNLSFIIGASAGGDGNAVWCGFEILNADGSDAFALDCGGPAVGAFQAETYDDPSLAFPFERPGPMVADNRGDLWIIQEANDHPLGITMTSAYPGAVLCYSPDGTFTGREITDVANPTAIAYDSVNDRLLVADNGPNQNIRFYTDLAAAPTLSGTFGEQGGIFSGPNPGLIYDQGTDNYDRFYGLTGVGIDAAGDIYVNSGMMGTDLRAFSPTGSLLWMVEGLPFCNTPGIDPDSDGADAYSPFWHGSLDLSKTAPGSEWAFQSYDWNPTLYGAVPRQGGSQSMVRRLGPNHSLFMYTSGQGVVGYCGIYRYGGETAIPCGQISADGSQIWVDANGDGIETPDEVVTGPASGYLSRFYVDSNGDLWFAFLLTNSVSLRHYKFMGLNSIGAPIYDFNAGDYEDIPYPGIGVPVSTWGEIADVKYDAQRDSMYLLGPASPYVSPGNIESYLARYVNWSTGNRTPRWLIDLPDPSVDYNVQYEVGQPYGLAHVWDGMDVAADKLFIASLWGNINVYNTTDGSLDRVMSPGPEVSGSCAWEDASQGLTAFKRANGEFVVFTENSGYDAKNNLFRIPPSGVDIPPYVSITSPQASSLIVAPASVTITANAGDDDGTVSQVAFYNGTTLLETVTSAPYSYTWQNVGIGTYTLTAQATDNDGVTTTSAPVTINVLAHYPPTVSITAPANDTYYGASPVSIPITATAAEVQGSIASVAFYDGTTLIGTATSDPYEVTWSGMPPGAYSITAVATDSYGQSVTSAPIAVTVVSTTSADLFAGLSLGTLPSGPNGWTRNPLSDDQYDVITFSDTLGSPPDPPCMSILAEGDSQYQYAYRTLGANSGLPYWKISGQLLFAYYSSTDTRTEYRILINDAQGNTIVDFERLVWNDSDATNYIQINGQTVVPGSLADHSAIDAVSDVWNPISIESYGGQIVLNYGSYSLSVPPLPGSDPTSPATLALEVGYWCYAGQTVYFDDLAFTTPAVDSGPTVSLTSPSNNAQYTVPGSIPLAATASPTTGTITQVQFFNGSTLIGTSRSAPYAWDWTNATPGTYGVTAVATDSWNMQTTSNPVTINVTSSVKYVITPEPTVNGTLSPSIAQAIRWGGTLAITATPAANFAMGSFTVDGNPVVSPLPDGTIVTVSGDVLTFTNLQGSHTVGASFTLSTYYEGDVLGHGTVDLADWVEIGRIVVGLAPQPTGEAYQCADCSPRSTCGSGQAIGLADWVQTGRYVVGLDPATPAGGPMAPSP